MKSSIVTDFGEMVQQATNLVEDIEIPASTFEVPEGLEIRSMNRGGGPGALVVRWVEAHLWEVVLSSK